MVPANFSDESLRTIKVLIPLLLEKAQEHWDYPDPANLSVLLPLEEHLFPDVEAYRERIVLRPSLRTLIGENAAARFDRMRQEYLEALVDVSNPALGKEIFESDAVDQAVRQIRCLLSVESDFAPKEIQDQVEHVVREIEHLNTAWLREVIQKFGFPTISLVGKAASYRAWRLTQHADNCLDFQREVLRILLELRKEEVLPANVAYLWDRVAINGGGSQRYGTQFEFDKESGKAQPLRLEDESRVNQWRKEVGLDPLEETLEMLDRRRNRI